jgi:predicted secreted protein
MAQTKIFRDRVVSLEQTQEIGEKHLDLLTELAEEALPDFERTDHALEHEADLFCLLLKHRATGQTKRVSFTRMVLSDAARLPAVVENPHGPIRARIVDVIRSQAARGEISVTLRQLLTEEERVEADEIESEWRKKNEALLAAKRAEEERRAREERRLRQIEEQRRAEKRKRAGERPGQERQARGEKRPPPQAHPRRGDRRPQRPQQQGERPTPPPEARPQAQASGERQSVPTPQAHAQVAPGAEAKAGGGRRRRRRRGGRGHGGHPHRPQEPAS